MSKDVSRGFRPTSLYVNSVLSCSKLLIGKELRESSIVYIQLLHKSYAIARCMCRFVVFHKLSTYFSRIYHFNMGYLAHIWRSKYVTGTQITNEFHINSAIFSYSSCSMLIYMFFAWFSYFSCGFKVVHA